MISKQQYRKYLLKQMADDRERKLRQKDERMGVSRPQKSNFQNKLTTVQKYNHQIQPSLQEPSLSKKPKPQKKMTHLGITKEFNIHVGSSSGYESEDITPKQVYQRYPSKYETQSNSKHSQNSEFTRPISPTSANQVMGRGRNLLAMENMDPRKFQDQQRRKSQMQKILLQQINEQAKNKTMEKKRRIEEERKLQQHLERYGMFEGEGQERRRCKKMVTMEAYFPEINNPRSGSEDQPTRKVYHSKALSSQKRFVQEYQPQLQPIKSVGKYSTDPDPKRFMTESRQQFAHRPPIPSMKHFSVNHQFSRKDSLQKVEQVLSPKSNISKQKSSHNAPSQLHFHRQAGFDYKSNHQQKQFQIDINLQSSAKQSQVETVNQQKYDKLSWQLKKVRQQILAQRQLMAQSLANVNQQAQTNVFQKLKPQSPRQSNKVLQKQIRPQRHEKCQNYFNENQRSNIYLNLEESQLLCESKKVPIMSKGTDETLTMSRIDDFALGEISMRRHIEEPSFMSKNQFIDPSTKRNKHKNIEVDIRFQPINENIFGGDTEEEGQYIINYREKRTKNIKEAPNYKRYYETDS